MIYIVEDDSAIRELEQYALQSNGYEAVGFESSEPFWQAVHTAPPELVILDVMLPGEDGFSILKKLRAAPSLRRLPIIMITAKSSELDTVRGLDCGADDYITKPFNLDILLLRIQKLLQWTQSNHEKFGKMEVSPSEITISSLDEQLIEKAIRIVEENMDNSEFSVEELSAQIGISRSGLCLS